MTVIERLASLPTYAKIGIVAGSFLVILAAAILLVAPTTHTATASFALFEDQDNNNTMMIGFLGAGYSAEVRRMSAANQWGIGNITTYFTVPRYNADPEKPEAYLWPENATGVLIEQGPDVITYYPVDGSKEGIYTFQVAA